MGLLKDEEHVKDNRNAAGLIETPTSLEPSAVKTDPKGLSPKKTLPSTSFSNSPRRKKKTGIRQARRIDNNNFLKTLLDDDFQAGEPDIGDFISSHSSAFEQLFLQEKNMEIWSEFMNRSGEEQDRFLQEVEEGMIKVAKKASLEQDNNGNAFTKLEIPTKEETPVDIQDKRSEHPAHSPKDCFNRISTRLQTMLRRRHLPKGALELHEGELMMWFTDDPGSVFISTLHSSFDRLLLHAVCQYLGLSSESFDCGGKRQTRVENNNESFNPPAILLSTFLDSLR
ncbi:R3H domain-containing protein 4-like [Strongylocentrotus purpuratus]|uniref:R3H-associated N-terminal domain-containing protein n=1 Tax=Strongylocentrotus purpuratus TaxID=7668 RepID=A0A7M7P0Q7_STRPU|nr:R3H domain-containing protein 4-like [Strongylocentrotus purpuratus]